MPPTYNMGVAYVGNYHMTTMNGIGKLNGTNTSIAYSPFQTLGPPFVHKLKVCNS